LREMVAVFALRDCERSCLYGHSIQAPRSTVVPTVAPILACGYGNSATGQSFRELVCDNGDYATGHLAALLEYQQWHAYGDAITGTVPPADVAVNWRGVTICGGYCGYAIPPIMERCSNCERTIGNLETPYLWDEKCVCQGCHEILAGRQSAADQGGGGPIVSLNCRNCGAALKVAAQTRFLTCQYCKSSLEVRYDGSVAYTHVLGAIKEDTSAMARDLAIMRLRTEIDQRHTEAARLQDLGIQHDAEWKQRKDKSMTIALSIAAVASLFVAVPILLL
jgi:hypothetical protein